MTDLAAASSAKLRLRISRNLAEREQQLMVDAAAQRQVAQAEANRLAGDVDTALRRSRLRSA
ncbi:hypothetical protein [Cryptosporangium sp. NPDC048952]|uniref:hypothetical protein n=1 Tax=Cryptosporangium sp. NPDC048952 TaxID=3363961 RepID=UPI00371196D4